MSTPTSDAVAPTARVNERGYFAVAETDEFFIEVFPALFNNRLVLIEKSNPNSYVAGWCYDKGPAAFLAGAVFDPDVEDEPAGWKKRVGSRRRARRHDPARNVDRCEHGTLSTDACERCDPHGLARRG